MTDESRGFRLFTVDEANALLPQLRTILADLQDARRTLLDAQRALSTNPGGGPHSNGHVTPDGQAARLTHDVEAAQERLTVAAREISALGCELKDPERGMVDFRTLRDGRVAYLCWLVHEPRVLFWHELDGGFAGRQPLE
ncbi:MAG: hypothetical protein QOF51_2261 [Chloroflexota bacterium]|jgi:hypothetical protein|nr:hypothetical protein [Chloroflexota bacterium]